MKVLLIVTAMIEVGAGAALVFGPSTTVMLLLGAPIETSVSVTLARVAGTALLTLGVANWLAQYDAQSCAARGLVAAMVLYNLGTTSILFAAGFWSQTAGVLLWPAVFVHAAMTAWCMTNLLRTRAQAAK